MLSLVTIDRQLRPLPPCLFVIVIAISSSETPEGLTNYLVYIRILKETLMTSTVSVCCSVETLLMTYILCTAANITRKQRLKNCINVSVMACVCKVLGNEMTAVWSCTFIAVSLPWQPVDCVSVHQVIPCRFLPCCSAQFNPGEAVSPSSLCHGRHARWRKWRACDVGEAKEGLENELWRSWSNGRD